MLDGQINIMNHTGIVFDFGDQGIVDFVHIAVQKADSRNFGVFADGADQLD